MTHFLGLSARLGNKPVIFLLFGYFSENDLNQSN